MRKKLGTILGKDWMLGYVLIAPSIILLITFAVFPILQAIYNSLFDWHLSSYNSRVFIGFENFRTLMNSANFKRVLSNTIQFTIGTVPVSMLISLVIALPLSTDLKFRSFYRSAYFVPVVTPVVAVSLGWMLLYNVDYGLLNYCLESIGLPAQTWVSMPQTAMLSVIIMSVWKGLGTGVVLYISGLNSIPGELYEAARIDGARKMQVFRLITWPLILPTTSFILIISTIGSFQAFGQIHVMTKGGPIGATATLVYDLYLNAFSYMKMGYASAEGVVLFICLLVFTIIQRALAQRKEGDLK